MDGTIAHSGRKIQVKVGSEGLQPQAVLKQNRVFVTTQFLVKTFDVEVELDSIENIVSIISQENVYISKDKAFSFQYPKEWFRMKGATIFTNYDPTKAPGRDGVPHEKIKIDIHIKENHDNLTVTQLLEELDEEGI